MAAASLPQSGAASGHSDPRRGCSESSRWSRSAATIPPVARAPIHPTPQGVAAGLAPLRGANKRKAGPWRRQGSAASMRPRHLRRLRPGRPSSRKRSTPFFLINSFSDCPEGPSTYLSDQKGKSEGRSTYWIDQNRKPEGRSTYSIDQNRKSEGRSTCLSDQNRKPEGRSTCLSDQNGKPERRSSTLIDQNGKPERRSSTLIDPNRKPGGRSSIAIGRPDGSVGH